jgi:hypothetical protein
MHLFDSRGSVRIAVLAGVLAVLMSPASGGSRDNLRVAPAACEPVVANVAENLREPSRRLETNRDRPDAARSQAEILAGVLSDPKNSATLAKLLNCLANGGQ